MTELTENLNRTTGGTFHLPQSSTLLKLLILQVKKMRLCTISWQLQGQLHFYYILPMLLVRNYKIPNSSQHSKECIFDWFYLSCNTNKNSKEVNPSMQLTDGEYSACYHRTAKPLWEDNEKKKKNKRPNFKNALKGTKRCSAFFFLWLWNWLPFTICICVYVQIVRKHTDSWLLCQLKFQF